MCLLRTRRRICVLLYCTTVAQLRTTVAQLLTTNGAHAWQGKIYNCGGGGSCGTCAVNVVAGAGNCSPKGPGEKKLLDKKPASYRLSCCTMVTGPITVKTKP